MSTHHDVKVRLMKIAREVDGLTWADRACIGQAIGLLDTAESRAALRTAQPVPAGKLGDGARYCCRKCGEQNTIEFNSARIVARNPYTGLPRDARDIASDPEGKLIVAPGAPIQAASEPASQGVTEDLANRVQSTIDWLKNGRLFGPFPSIKIADWEVILDALNARSEAQDGGAK